MPDRLIVFVCSGNVCRSPMAEYLLKEKLGLGSGWKVSSAGVSAGFGMRASEEAILALDEMGINMTPHRSRAITEKLANDASLVVVMTAAHREHLKLLYPAVEGNVYLLKSFSPAGGEDVRDPIGSSLDVYRQIRDEIAEALPRLISYMKTFK